MSRQRGLDPMRARHLRIAVLAAAIAAGTAGCGSRYLPLPVPETPTAAPSVGSPLHAAPPSNVVFVEESPGFCSHGNFADTATFLAHFNASDGWHYHGWLPAMGPPYWVAC